jgi:hypothetical protein
VAVFKKRKPTQAHKSFYAKRIRHFNQPFRTPLNGFFYVVSLKTKY